MREFSLDLSAEAIHSARTREYFIEVLKSYYSENYRSAIVMLYTISVADLVYKVRDLQDLYSDPNATTIMAEITRLQTAHPNSPDWELKLIEMVKDQTNLLEPADYLHLTTLQKHRHLCAHPVLTQNFELYSPNRETVRSHIRNMLEGLLTKPPLLSRKILDDFLLNLTQVKGLIKDDADLERHLKSKYLSKLRGNALKQVFRAIWKIVLKVRDQQSTDNRAINLKAILIIIKNNYNDVVQMIRNEKDYFSDVSMDNINEFTTLLNHFPALFPELSDSLSVITKTTIKTDADLDMRAIFQSSDVNEHVNKIISGVNDENYDNPFITSQSIIDVYNHAISNNEKAIAHKLLIHMFGKSSGFDMADTRFDTLIKPFLSDFSITELTSVIGKVNGNGQISSRRRAVDDNRIIKAKTDIENNTFDYTPYSSFHF